MFQDKGFRPISFRNIDIFWILIKGYGIFRNFEIYEYCKLYWDIENIKFGIWDINRNLFWDMGYCLLPRSSLSFGTSVLADLCSLIRITNIMQ